MTKNGFTEFELCLKKYFNNSTKICFLNTIKDFSKDFFDNYTRINFRDNPDGYLKIGSKIIIIEHFEYDATKNNKKGSETRVEKSRINRKLDDKCYSLDNVKYAHEEMNVTHSTEQLRDNFIKIFSDHNSKINQYKKALIEDDIIDDNDEVIFMFCCEDKTIFGCLGIEDQIYSFNILNIKECLDVILESKIDYLLLCNSYQNRKEMKLAPVSKQLLEISAYSLASEIKMIDFKPKMYTARINLPHM